MALDVIDGSVAEIGVGSWDAVLDEHVRWQRLVEEIGEEIAIALVLEGVGEAQSFVQLRLQQLIRPHAWLNHQKLRRPHTCTLSSVRVQLLVAREWGSEPSGTSPQCRREASQHFSVFLSACSTFEERRRVFLVSETTSVPFIVLTKIW